MRKKLLFCLALLLFSGLSQSFSQVGIGTTNPDPSAMLDVASVTKGLLLPRMTIAERNAIPSPAAGLMVYCTDNNHFYVNKGTAVSSNWVMVSTPWLQTGSDIWFSTGRVGVGTSAPDWSFDVTGDLNFTGTLRKNGTPVVTGVSAVTATSPMVSSGGATPNLSMPMAGASASGFLHSTDWNIFNNKQNALTFGNLVSTTTDITVAGGTGAVKGGGTALTLNKGNLTEVTSSVLTITGGTGAVLGLGTGIQVRMAGASQPGYLSSIDWNNFNNKISSQWTTSGTSIYYALGLVGIGITAPLTNLHISESNGDVVPALKIEQLGAGDAALEYKQMASSVTSGIHHADAFAYKICSTPTLTGGVYSAPGQLFRIHTAANKQGITDFNHQSRCRAHMIINGIIPANVWTILNFGQTTFDEHNEFSPVNGIFIAREEGYYQVNARVEFDLSEAGVFVPNGYVSIAIFKNGFVYAEGNNLQVVMGAIQPTQVLYKNNAPNVGDVLWLQAGDMVDIRAFQNYTLPVGFTLPNHEKTYFSIHKIS